MNTETDTATNERPSTSVVSAGGEDVNDSAVPELTPEEKALEMVRKHINDLSTKGVEFLNRQKTEILKICEYLQGNVNEYRNAAKAVEGVIREATLAAEISSGKAREE